MSGESKNPELEKEVPTNKKRGIFKQVTAGVGLRTPSVESSLTGEKIPNSHKYKYQTKDIDSIIDKSELEMLRKNGILFAFKALDKTLEEYRRALNGGVARHGTVPGSRLEVWESPHPLFSEEDSKRRFYDGRKNRKITKVEKKKLEDVYMLREKTIRLLDLILFRYPATKIVWRPDMTNLLEKMKKDFGNYWEYTSEPYYTPGEPPEFYKILDVKKDVTAKQIKKAYRKMARKHHPDKGGDQETFKKVSAAYEELRDPQLKENYDAATASCWEEKRHERWVLRQWRPKPLERDYLMRALRHTRRQMDLFHAWENENPGTNYIYKGRKALHLLHKKVHQYMMVIQEKEMTGGKRKKTRGGKRKSHKKRNKGKRKTKKRRKRKTKKRRRR